MSTEQHLKLYRKAMRYMDNAAKMLSEKGKNKDGHYQNIKCVRVACGAAYSGLLLATECFLEMKGKPLVRKKGRRLTITQYLENLAWADSKALDYFNDAYTLLGLDGYLEYRLRICDENIQAHRPSRRESFEEAELIIFRAPTFIVKHPTSCFRFLSNN